jgi:aspartate/methionine/tyrosine aminotransferase
MAGIDFNSLAAIPLHDSPNRGHRELREEVAKLYPGVDSEEVLICTGTSEALYLAFHLLLKPKSKVALLWPAFQALYEVPLMLGAEVIKVEAQSPLQANIWESVDADLFVINHPHNPTGADFKPPEVEQLTRILKSKNKPVLFDEHYRFFDRHLDIGWTGVSPKDMFYGTGSFTKCFGVTGLRIGWLIADKDFIRRARSFKDYITHTVSPISEKIALGLLQNKDTFISKIKAEVESNIRYFESHLHLLSDIQDFQAIDGGLVGWAKLKEGVSSENYADQLMEQTGVFVLPGKDFEEEGFLRIGFGESKKRFELGIQEWIKYCK